MAYGLLFAIPKVTCWCLRYCRIENTYAMFIWMRRLFSNSFNVTTTSEPYLPPCAMRLTSQTRKTLSKLSTVFPDRYKSLRLCCSMSVIAVILSNRTQRIRNSVCDSYPLPWPTLTCGFPGKRTLKHSDGQVDRKIEGFRTTLLKLHKALVDEATVVTEITALQILDDVGVLSANVGIISTNVGITSANVGIMSANVGTISANVGIISANMRTISADVGRISSQLDGMATQLKWVSSHLSDPGT